MQIQSKENFILFVKQIEQKTNYKKPKAFGIARVDRGQINKDKILQANFALINYEQNYGSAAILLESFMQRGINIDFNLSEFTQNLTIQDINFALECFAPFIEEEGHKNIDLLKIIKENFKNESFVFVCLFENEAPLSVEAVYLKLYLLSHKKMPLRSVNLDGAFGLLSNVAWSNDKPIELDYLRENELSLKMKGEYPKIDFVDKFPRFLAHIIPDDNTRILDTAKVRMGASLAAGTTIMPGASYINFNAGTTGACMVEGRISSSAIVGEGSDIGGGASILGVLSGTSGNAISVGKACLLGANSVTGIPLGDNCIVDAGIAVLEGTKFLLKDKEKLKKINTNFDFSKEIYKGIELKGLNGLHFRQDSISGAMIVSANKKVVVLNSTLH
ncbi:MULTISPECIES: tetrahydrodipicolinate N-succinyltransferase N-terminal domain-containing protein [unclassified Campylobacter]|uniref:tetrahydrodipicolinate N-succinyltransferase N-terminal domain-containing protein n=1 Tax=unclassified Campylobacter TaxID=2593542 RepID=UPI0012383537|nr:MULTISPECIES: tetrahydrodipicolinate N-succinyltransferase N-terminal domain-containing protein [unclassified Campylobacter]KAA6227242.1 2,3,4,5-tetrahydropyridine-2,6-carboxylate N-succinyltransferase [Campylobacter sp. LR286c]KAA6227885.1 2,3,4,5-tetrahydropyridine-2,6-carboxylate N-succinyltransferase [Campylobacter sp. LR185c]KAA6228293.1 2,3,4,5-tetrahydropyridine-2,6-carboxylate N-succinyltransferase [Campylobacter sp. LR196d]KAA6229295.1 2,3,4,5-tetrahydropyridine-2,6-carboxylate N-su